MTIPPFFTVLSGNWTGVNRLWLRPDEPARVSDTLASAALTAGERFMHFRYTWVYEDQPQEGCLWIGQEGQAGPIRGVWIDSWHMGDAWMICQGSSIPSGGLSLLGSYPAPTGPDWGWRITFTTGADHTLCLTMMNITPDGQEMLAVEARYRPKPPVEIIPYQLSWPHEFRTIARTLRQGLGDLALRIDHIGSTAVPGLAAKDVIDLQISVAALDQHVFAAMQAIGYTAREGVWRDHRPAGMDGPDSDWEKWLFDPPPGQRRTHTHVRVIGRPNQRYPLLFRDYLRAHPAVAEAYAELKRRLALNLADPLTYPDVKDPAVDLIYLPAEEWAAATNWQSGPADG